MKLYAYKIVNEKASNARSTLLAYLFDKIENKEHALDRCFELNNDAKEKDLLSYYVLDKPKSIFGMMIRIAPAEGVSSFSESDFNVEMIKPQDLVKKSVGKGLACIGSDYFMLNSTHIVSTFPKSRITAFRNYINWFLASYLGEGEEYLFDIVISKQEGTVLQDIKEVTVSNKFVESKVVAEEEQTKFISLALDTLKGLFIDIPDAKELLESNVVSASLVLKVNRRLPKKVKEDEKIKKALGSILSCTNDDSDVNIKLKNGKSLSVGKMHMMKEIQVSTQDDGGFDESEIKSGMNAFLNELSIMA